MSQTAKDVSEGVTEHFTKMLCVEMNIPRGEHYKDQLDHVQKLIPLVGEDTLAAAYFQNEVPDLEVAVDAKKGSGTYRQWVEAALDPLEADAEVEVSVPSLGHRSAFVGAVLGSLPEARFVPGSPPAVRRDRS